jgi:hypothetical protein
LLSNSPFVAIAILFVAGLLLFGVGTALSKRPVPAAAGPPAPVTREEITWPALVDDSLHDSNQTMRLEMIERLALVDTPWSREILERARAQERDPSALEAIERALARTS